MYLSIRLLFLALSVLSLLVFKDSSALLLSTVAIEEEEDIATISRSFLPDNGLGNGSGNGRYRKKRKADAEDFLESKFDGRHHQKMKIFAVATDTTNENFLIFNTSAQKSGLVIHLLGVGDTEMREVPLTENEKSNTKTSRLPFHSRSNFGRKILHFHKALLKIEDVNTFVMLVDAYDSIFLSSYPRDLVVAFDRARHYAYRLRMRYSEHAVRTEHYSLELLERYKKFPSIIASAEKNCWPDKSLSLQYPSYSIGHVMRYLNSGVVAGSAKAFLQLFSSLPYTGNETSDQRYWVAALLASHNETFLPIIDLDYQNHLVSSISKSSWDLLMMTEAKSTATGGFGGSALRRKGVGVKNLMGTPKILHFPNNKDKLKYFYEILVSQSLRVYQR